MTSECSTPAKRRKTSWNFLLSSVDVNLVPEDVNLEKLLSENVEADEFATISEYPRKAILKDLLEEREELIASILHSTKNAITGTCKAPLRQQIDTHQLAPSKVDAYDILCVARIILNSPSPIGPDMVALKRLIADSPSIVDLPPIVATEPLPIADPKEIVSIVNLHAKTTLNLLTQEAAHYGMLINLCVHFATSLSQTLGKSYRFVNQFNVTRNSKPPGPPPHTDSCIVLVETSETDVVPRILYECKRMIPSEFISLDEAHVIEVLLQAYYCIHHFKINQLLICLTDLFNWHYILVKKSGEKIQIVGYYSLTGLKYRTMEYKVEYLVEHTKFLVETERKISLH